MNMKIAIDDVSIILDLTIIDHIELIIIWIIYGLHSGKLTCKLKITGFIGKPVFSVMGFPGNQVSLQESNCENMASQPGKSTIINHLLVDGIPTIHHSLNSTGILRIRQLFGLVGSGEAGNAEPGRSVSPPHRDRMTRFGKIHSWCTIQHGNFPAALG